jgi:hypothetical protein
MLQAGAGTLVIASAVVSASPAPAVTAPSAPTIEQRMEQARAALGSGQASRRDQPAPDRLAWWGNRAVIVRPVPVWPNWPNWHNWHNWANYGGPPGAWGNY